MIEPDLSPFTRRIRDLLDRFEDGEITSFRSTIKDPAREESEATTTVLLPTPADSSLPSTGMDSTATSPGPPETEESHTASTDASLLPRIETDESGGRSLTVTEPGFQPDALPDLEMQELIGKGGMGQVHAARQVALGRVVAVKRSKGGVECRNASRELLREGRLLARLEHPNIPPVHLLGRDEDDRIVLVMKRIQGQTWLSLLSDPGHEAWAEAHGDPLLWNLKALIPVTRAIEYAHSVGILHRDIKTDNIMIGDFGQVYLLDWGLAVELDEQSLYLSEKFAGTPAYAAPEMVTPELPLTPKTDIYLLGATLHELVTGRPRHSARSIEAVLFSAARAEPYDYGIDVSTDLARICNRAMHKQPESRFENVGAFREALEDFIDSRPFNALLATATGLLKQLASLVDRPPTRSDDDEAFHRLGIECRFALEEALRERPGNSEAARGLVRCIDLLIRHAIAQGNIQAGRMLLGELAQHEGAQPDRIDELDTELTERERDLTGRQDELSTQIRYTMLEQLEDNRQRIRKLEGLLDDRDGTD